MCEIDPHVVYSVYKQSAVISFYKLCQIVKRVSLFLERMQQNWPFLQTE